MTDQLTALRELVAQVEAGTLESYAPVIEFALYPFRQKMADVYAANDAYRDHSLDAAKALHEALLPGWVIYQMGWWSCLPDRLGQPKARVELWQTHTNDQGEHWHGSRDLRVEGCDDIPARAWLIADLKALIAELEATQ